MPKGLVGSSNYFGFLNNLVTIISCESLKEIGEMTCITPARSSRKQPDSQHVHNITWTY